MGKSLKNSVEKLDPRSIYIKGKLSIPLNQQFEMLRSLFLLNDQDLLELRFQSLAFALYKASLKNKNRSGTILSASFSPHFLKKIIFHVILY